MATATLPYPNMDFTPLDVLTAAEMDQMVANDEYLKNFCNGLADGSNLSDGVIQTRHLKTTSTTWVGPYGISATIYRVGNICWISNSFVISRAITSGGYDVDEPLPQGYTPTANMAISIKDCYTSSNNACLFYNQSIGKYQMQANGQLGASSAWRGMIQGIWHTNDSWPN